MLFTSACTHQNDFDTLCTYFDSLKSEANLDKMTPLDKYTYISDRVTNIKADSDARLSWEAIVNLKADERYNMFIEAAKASFNKPWQCESMQNHLVILPD